MARLNAVSKEWAYRYYLADCEYLKGQEMAPRKRLYDLMHTPVEKRDAAKIISDTLKNAGLRIE